MVVRLLNSLLKFVILLAITLFSLYCFHLLRTENVAKLNDQSKSVSVIINPTALAPATIIAASETVDWRNLTEAQVGRLSTLGKWLLSAEGTRLPEPRDNSTEKKYLILIWKYGPMLERRHIRHFSNETFSPWKNCSVNNCRLSYDSANLEIADAVLFHLHRIKGLNDLPKDVNYKKRISQRWVFVTDESPINTFIYGNQQISNYNGFFNWSMSYRMDSDVPVPYGRTILLKNAEKLSSNLIKNLFSSKSKLVAIMGSNCGGDNNRWEYVRKLKQVLGNKLDIYGHCLEGDTESCPGHFDKDCPLLGTYKFYLAFENSNCVEYLTEKPFWHGYAKNSVPIIMGASRTNCKQFLPPNSFIHIDDFANPQTLADYIIYLGKNDNEYLKFHQWRESFKVLNEHGYFQTISRHYCRLCEALNYNQLTAKIYSDLEQFWNKNRDCWR